MLIYTQGMYIMHVPFDSSEESRGGQTLYIPGLTSLLTSCSTNGYYDLRVIVFSVIVRCTCFYLIDFCV